MFRENSEMLENQFFPCIRNILKPGAFFVLFGVKLNEQVYISKDLAFNGAAL